jgi:acid phosphatase type 7
VREIYAFLLGLAAAISSCYHLPQWYGDVVVHSRERTSVKQCGNGALTAEGKRHITREPYLQATTMTSTVVAFGSKLDTAEVSLFEPGTNIPVQAQRATYAGAGKRADGEVKVLAAELLRLDGGHLYCYQVTSNGVALTEPAPLTTAPPPGLSKPMKFVALGDSGTGGDAQKALKKRLTEVDFDFLLFLGDIAYKSGTPSQVQNNFFEIYADILKYVPAYPSIGNHERRTQEGRPYFEAFVLPKPERFYSFDWGDVHFVALDTTQHDTEQLEWLQQDLASTKQQWKIAFGHHPMYTNSLRGPQRGLREAYAKIFADGKVDLVVTGHEHQYERFRVGDVNYVVSGGGGAQLTRFFGMSKSIERAMKHHFLAFEVTADTLTMKVIDIEGTEIESMKLTKERPADSPKARVDGLPEGDQTLVAPERSIVPDEKLHDEPADDRHNP